MVKKIRVIEDATSSEEAPKPIATLNSCIIVPASWPIMCAPKILSVSLSDKIFTKPSVWPIAFALLLAVNGKTPLLYEISSCFKSSSVLPIDATSGAV